MNFRMRKQFGRICIKQLDTRLFSMGELEISFKANRTPDNKWVGHRQKWHRQLLSYAGKYEWRACLAAHAHILDLIKEGDITWKHDLNMIAIPIISGHALPATKPKPNTISNQTKPPYIPDKVFCNDFNKQEGCQKEDKHKMTFFSNEVTAWHMCSRCYKKDKSVQKHSAHECTK